MLDRSVVLESCSTDPGPEAPPRSRALTLTHGHARIDGPGLRDRVVGGVKKGALAGVREVLSWGGFAVHASPFTEPHELPQLRARAREIQRLHALQTAADVRALQDRYSQPTLGEIPVVHLLELLAQVIDPASAILACTSQLTHSLQIAEAMQADGVCDDLVFFALVHDIGKLALLHGEAPENIDGNGRTPIGEHEPGIGLDPCVLTFAHGELAHLRLGRHLPEHLAWLLRYHDIDVESCRPLFDERDRRHAATYLEVFASYDRRLSPYRIPNVRLDDYLDLLAARLPATIEF